MAAEATAPSALAHFDPADLLDALTTGIVMLDAQLCPVYANVAAQDLLAFSLKMARGRPFADFLHDANGLTRILRRALETGEGIADRELAVRPAGAPREVRTLDVTITPLTGLTGTHLLLELADTTQRQRITRENDLLARLGPAMESTRAVSRSASLMITRVYSLSAAAGSSRSSSCAAPRSPPSGFLISWAS